MYLYCFISTKLFQTLISILIGLLNVRNVYVTRLITSSSRCSLIITIPMCTNDLCWSNLLVSIRSPKSSCTGLQFNTWIGWPFENYSTIYVLSMVPENILNLDIVKIFHHDSLFIFRKSKNFRELFSKRW